MIDLAAALARLERAVARLEAAAREPRRSGNDELATAAAEIVGRVEAALRKLDQLLEMEAD